MTADLIDLYAPAAPGSLMRMISLSAIGRFRLARRDCELYSVQILSSGAWGRVRVLNGLGRSLWSQPSCFTGSFWLGGGAVAGLVAELAADDLAPGLTINWREADRAVV